MQTGLASLFSYCCLPDLLDVSRAISAASGLGLQRSDQGFETAVTLYLEDVTALRNFSLHAEPCCVENGLRIFCSWCASCAFCISP